MISSRSFWNSRAGWSDLGRDRGQYPDLHRGGHETTARALAWTLYCVAHCPDVRDSMEREIDEVIASGADPVEWLDKMPHVRASFEEAMRLYPPAPSINRDAIADDRYTAPSGETSRLRRAPPSLSCLDAASPRALLGQAADFRSLPLFARRAGKDRPFPVSALRGGSARLHRCDLCAAGSGDCARRSDAALPLRDHAADETLAGAEAHHPARGRTSHAGHASQAVKRRLPAAPSLEIGVRPVP